MAVLSISLLVLRFTGRCIDKYLGISGQSTRTQHAEVTVGLKFTDVGGGLPIHPRLGGDSSELNYGGLYLEHKL